MSAEDAPLALRRHATSKLSTLAGLQRIATFGFRGEALAAVASSLQAASADGGGRCSSGTEVRIEAGAIVSVGAAAARPGTQVVVEDLFYAVPARRKFLRRQETELRHCEQAVLRLARSPILPSRFAWSKPVGCCSASRRARATSQNASPPRSAPRCIHTCSPSRSIGWTSACMESSPRRSTASRRRAGCTPSSTGVTSGTAPCTRPSTGDSSRCSLRGASRLASSSSSSSRARST